MASLLANDGGALISLDELNADGVPAISMIARHPAGPRSLFCVGSFVIPFCDFSQVVRIFCREGHLTGFRGAAATARARLLPSRSEDERYEATLPEGPLSRLHGYMREIEATLRLVVLLEVRFLITKRLLSHIRWISDHCVKSPDCYDLRELDSIPRRNTVAKI